MTAKMKTIVVLFIIAMALLLESQGAPVNAKDLRRERRGADDDVSLTRSLRFICLSVFMLFILFDLYLFPFQYLKTIP